MSNALLCPGCGAPLTPSGNSNEAICQYCQTHVQLNLEEYNDNEEYDEEDGDIEWEVIECPNCGELFQVLSDLEVVACPYCDGDIDFDDED